MRKGIDVSENNGAVDWQAVKNAGIEFAIVRTGYGRGDKDSMFDTNVAGAHAVGLQVGAYHYSYALNPESAVEEAQFCRRIIDDAGCLLELPVFFDMEDADYYKAKRNFDKSTSTSICKAFLDNLGLDCGVYASYDWFENFIDWRSLGCAIWNAQWGNADDLKGYMWQYTNQENIGGKLFDANILYS